jgi:hypothetical protein
MKVFISVSLFISFSDISFTTTDILKRVSIVIHQHILKCEQRLTIMTDATKETGLFRVSKMNLFLEDLYVTPQYVYHFVRAPISRLGFLYGIRKLETPMKVPELAEVHKFLRDLFFQAQLSAECSIVCLVSFSLFVFFSVADYRSFH